jgi:hypothetical protein
MQEVLNVPSFESDRNPPTAKAYKTKEKRKRVNNNQGEREVIVRGITLVITVMRQKKFAALKVSLQCPLVFLVKVGCKQVIAMRSEKGGILGVHSWRMQHRKKLRIWSEILVGESPFKKNYVLAKVLKLILENGCMRSMQCNVEVLYQISICRKTEEGQGILGGASHSQDLTDAY